MVSMTAGPAMGGAHSGRASAGEVHGKEILSRTKHFPEQEV